MGLMENNWSSYEGNLIGPWLLESFLGARDGRAFYAATDTPNGRSVMVQLARAGDSADGLLWSWKKAKDLVHDHLMPVHACGEVNLDGVLLAFAVQELPSDDLSERLTRDLTAVRNPATAESVSSAINFLHTQGLCHGSLIPGNIFFLGDAVALSVDTLRPAEESGMQLDEQQFVAMFREPSPPRQTIPTPSYGLRVAMAAVAVSAVFIVGYSLFHKPAKPAAPLPPPVVARSPQPSPPEVTEPQNTDLGVADRTTRVHRSAAPWAVITATYNGFQAADQRAQRLRRNAPKLNPHVFPPAGQGQRYFVVLGSGLTRDEAEHLRRTAIAEGAPGDTYITKLTED
ncbi:MAG TPA: hypothetical protein VKU01_02665 [Bryobacteraceae bacterium]|nr:hypothetical protein [Bryobacteraceae bacterium]